MVSMMVFIEMDGRTP